MTYTLITKTGKIMQFYIEAVAKMYQTINGGVIVTDAVYTMENEYEIQ